MKMEGGEKNEDLEILIPAYLEHEEEWGLFSRGRGQVMDL